MLKKEVTTKGTGHGIGLYNVSEILNHYDNVKYTIIKKSTENEKKKMRYFFMERSG